MKRRNVQMAFIGEGTPSETDVQELVEGDEAVEIAVLGGTVLVTVPAGTPDEELFEKLSVLGGELQLENGLTLSFEIYRDATGAQFAATPSEKRTEPHEGLSSLPHTPGGA
ncbi:MAG TPA: hypothetical protein VKZ60_08970 [Chloroflexota bacterium]|nr:hypothetical protein [Chloroflexota bacterium]